MIVIFTMTAHVIATATGIQLCMIIKGEREAQATVLVLCSLSICVVTCAIALAQLLA